ncbi:hypothetical protein [Pseudobacteriovorax antillogorgiicola]|uniref:Y_Y_Y domain-containing protein n=1 Tax=Pseudobacteriovorax antillogorgiicola TaxID=1513793 RepID=A0A1Y6BC60_9BACT|nr:hypothetical protein [Pseudobacteriovorax antillogorgiicola]TCS58905.1 YXYXY domain-containing protein [Pseudobacteriovorax antillogorgiicola]SME93313.1 Y_Y_Y domain-containing protein [Pseudobacteriovorax antillogorgiicola]
MRSLLLIILFSCEVARGDLRLRHFSSAQHNFGIISDSLEDHRGLIFAASDQGVLEFDGIDWRTIPVPSAITTLGMNREGKVYTAGRHIMGYLSPNRDGDMEFQEIKLPQNKDLGDIVAIEPLGDDVAFIRERGLVVIHDQLTVIESVGLIKATFHDDNAVYVIDNKSGLMKVGTDRLSEVPGGAELGATAFAKTSSGKWVGASLSLGVFDLVLKSEPQIRSWKGIDRTRFKGSHISDLAFNNHYMFIATLGAGLQIYTLDKIEWVPLTDEQMESVGTIIQSLHIDSKGQLWISGPRGLFVLADREFLVTDEAAKDQVASFTSYLRSCIDTKTQETIFGGAFFKELGGVQLAKATELNRPVLEHTTNALRFNYSSSEIVLADEIEYQTYLEGFDPEWSQWSKRTYREFTNLMWNDYSFKVRARTPDGVVSEIVYFDFEISPPWYEQNWFYLIQLLILAILFGIVVYLKGWTKRKKASKKINDVIMGTVWGYSFATIGMQGMVWALSGGAAFLAIVTKILTGIFLKPLQKKVEAKMIGFQDDLAQDLSQRLKPKEKDLKKNRVPPSICRMRAKTSQQRLKDQGKTTSQVHYMRAKNPRSVRTESGVTYKESA